MITRILKDICDGYIENKSFLLPTLPLPPPTPPTSPPPKKKKKKKNDEVASTDANVYALFLY